MGEYKNLFSVQACGAGTGWGSSGRNSQVEPLKYGMRGKKNRKEKEKTVF